MGEYFNGHKLGTCEHLMYVTRDELEYFREKYGMQRNQSAGSLPFIKSYLDLNCGWIYRFPQFHDQVTKLEDLDRRKAEDYLRLYVPGKLDVPHRDFSQYQFYNHETGFSETFNLKFCPMDAKQWQKGLTPTRLLGWNEKPENIATIPIDVVGNKYTVANPDGYTLFRTTCCNAWFTLNQAEIDEYIIPYMYNAGLDWEAQYIKARESE